MSGVNQAYTSNTYSTNNQICKPGVSEKIKSTGCLWGIKSVCRRVCVCSQTKNTNVNVIRSVI